MSTACLLAFLQGVSDSYSNIANVFQPVISSQYQCAKNIATLKLPAPPVPMAKKSRFRTARTDAKLIKALQKVGIKTPEIQFASDDCRLCRHQQPSKSRKSRFITTCQVTAAGDWLSEATFLRLSGLKGRHFCNFCTAPLGSLQKG